MHYHEYHHICISLCSVIFFSDFGSNVMNIKNGYQLYLMGSDNDTYGSKKGGITIIVDKIGPGVTKTHLTILKENM